MGNPSRRKSFWRTIVLPLVVLSAIGAFLWYADSGNELPLLGGRDSGADVATQTDGTFFSLESQGIKLGAASGPAAKIGEPAPDFALLDLNGKVVRLSDFRGQTIVLNFWATWCAPCRREFPEFVEAYERNKDNGLVVIAVNIRENAGSVRRFAEDFGAKFPVVIDAEGTVATQYRVQGLPVTWFIDSQGVVRSEVIGLVTKGILRTNLAEAGFMLSP